MILNYSTVMDQRRNIEENLNEETKKLDVNGDEISRLNKRVCMFCLKEVDGSLRCGRCRTALYCSKECQKGDRTLILISILISIISI